MTGPITPSASRPLEFGISPFISRAFSDDILLIWLPTVSWKAPKCSRKHGFFVFTTLRASATPSIHCQGLIMRHKRMRTDPHYEFQPPLRFRTVTACLPLSIFSIGSQTWSISPNTAPCDRPSWALWVFIQILKCFCAIRSNLLRSGETRWQSGREPLTQLGNVARRTVILVCHKDQRPTMLR